MAERITGHTELIGLMAYPIRHSSSPAMQNEAFAEVGADYAYLAFEVDADEIEDAYEENTGHLIVNEFARMGKDYEAVSAVLCKNHGPFCWGKNDEDAVHSAVVLEEVAKMALRTEIINPKVEPAPQELQDKHYYRKHGANAYYGQN